MTEPREKLKAVIGTPVDTSDQPADADQGAEVHSFGAVAGELDGDTEVEVTAGAPEADLAVQMKERTADLQRLQAEYLNYKKRVERDRELVRQNATYSVLAPIIEVLDTIDRAREHGPLDDGFKSVADQLERVVAGLGLTRFGAPGDAFDPTIHEALSHVGEDPQVEVTTCQVIAKAGYRMDDRVVRAAQVLVVDPVTPAAPEPEAGEPPAEPGG